MKSKGQQRVIEIANDILNEYGQSCIDDTNCIGNERLLERLAVDDIIINDIFTGSKIWANVISSNYEKWLIEKATKEVSKNIERFDCNKMIFNGSIEGTWPYETGVRFTYEGGARNPLVTARAIFTLIKSMPLPTDNLCVRFYINSGITIVCEGNHRMLAFKLTGITDFPVTKVKYFDDYMHSSELNQALLALEKWFPNIRINNIPDDPKGMLQIYHDLNKNNVLLRYLQQYIDLKERLGIVDIKQLSVHIELYKFILLEKKEFDITRYLKKIFLIDNDKRGYYEKRLISGMKHWMEHDIKK